MKTFLCLLFLAVSWENSAQSLPYPVVDTGQIRTYDARREIKEPGKKDRFYGQDGSYVGLEPDYELPGNGTVMDKNTGLMWTRHPLEGRSYDQALQEAGSCRVGGYADWRLPTIKELYSLILFTGTDPNPHSRTAADQRPFIDAEVFGFRYGDPEKHERVIDAQYVSSTLYTATTMGGNKTVFGVNFADGRIKGYPVHTHWGPKRFFVLYVRENPDYGKNDFLDNGDGTVTDRATGLTWMQDDSGKGMDWPSALAYAEDLNFAGHRDWRLPNAKELQTIIDYSRSPDHTRSAAIDPVFRVTEIRNEGGGVDYPGYWTGTSHVRGHGSDSAVYFCFGRSLGYMSLVPGRPKVLMDVHGAGSQRSDPKTGDARYFPQGRGPQGDVIRIQNFVRCVRGGEVE